MSEKLPPFTPEELERAIRRSASRSLKRLAPLIADKPRRTPRGLRTPYSPEAWAKLTPEERIAHSRQILKASAFDELVSARGVTLGDGVVA